MFAALAAPKPTRFIIKERDRAALEPEGESLLIEVFGEYGSQATITTWRADVVPLAGNGNVRRITEIEELTTISGLYRLALNPAKQFELRHLTVQATDLTLEIPSGSAFVAETPEGPTAIVLLGRGRMRFAPSDAAERTQVRIFSGEDALATEFDAVFIRVRPAEVGDILPPAALKPVPVVPGDLRRASELFDGYIGQTFNLDLRDLSRERWSLIPTIGDLIAEVRTRRLGSLTYARSTKDAEDISLFDRACGATSRSTPRRRSWPRAGASTAKTSSSTTTSCVRTSRWPFLRIACGSRNRDVEEGCAPSRSRR